MKIRHNKKRNTAFIYETLIKEATVAIIKKDNKTKEKVISILKKHFSEDSVLKRHLDCYRSLYESHGLDHKTAEKILNEAKLASRLLDTEGLFVKQSDLIKDVNQEFTTEFYNTFVPSYKTLASITNIFSNKLSPKNTVILENQIIQNMTTKTETLNNTQEVDDLIFSSFVAKFNEKYDGELLDEQKILLNYYISSFLDNSLSLKTFLNEEIARLKTDLHNSLSTDEINSDSEMTDKTNRIIEKLNTFYNKNIDENVLLTVLKTQKLVREIFKDGDNS